MTAQPDRVVELTADYHLTEYALLPKGTRGTITEGPIPMGPTSKMLVAFETGFSMWVTERAVKRVEPQVITG